MQSKELLNLADTIQGEINRMCVTDDINELYNMAMYARRNINKLCTVRDVDLKMVQERQLEVKEIGYTECANAMLKMWIDNVLTDGEYNRIMDKLNAHHDAERRQDE